MTHIWIPKFKILEGETKAPRGTMEGIYTLRRVKADGRVVQELGPFHNLITDAGLDKAGTGGQMAAAFVGTGTATPGVSDTQLDVFKASATGFSTAWNSRFSYGPAPDYYCEGAGTWRFNQGVAAGNLTEVGVGWMEAGGGTEAVRHRCFSRALILDGASNPTTITVLPDEYLDVTYVLRFYPYIGADINHTLTLSGVTYNFVTRSLALGTNTQQTSREAANYGVATVYTGTAAGTPPTLAAINAISMTNAGPGAQLAPTPGAYTPGSYKSNIILSAALGAANLTYGIRGMVADCRYAAGGQCFLGQSFQSTITPAIPKDSTKVLSFGMSWEWGRK